MLKVVILPTFEMCAHDCAHAPCSRRRSHALLPVLGRRPRSLPFWPAKYGTEGSRTARAAADQQAGSDGADGEVQILGEQTWQDRDAAAREAAVELEE